MANQHEPVQSNEPSVWDYFIDRLKFWTKTSTLSEVPVKDSPAQRNQAFPWLTFAALVLALIAQITLAPAPGRTPWPGVILYGAALFFLVAAALRKEWQLPALKPDAAGPMSTSFRSEFLLIGIVLGIFAFILFGSGSFGFLNTLLWTLAVGFIFLAFWEPAKGQNFWLKASWKKLKSGGWQFHITRWTLIVLAVMAVVLFFNFHRLESVPPEMVSDQAEKLLDIHDVLNGRSPVYFPRNTGREVLHFYLTAAYMAIFNLDVSFLNLKVVAVFANLLTLFFIYLLGKEMGNKWVGLSAVLFAGIAYWPLLFTRLALRIPYYPLFVAPVMFFMVRGLRRQRINDILWTGFFLGLGLHGYTPFRIVPIFVVITVILYILHKPAQDRRLQAIFALVLITLISLVVFIPLLRYWLDNPDLFAYRAFSRLTGMEVGFQNSPLVIFLQNFWKASVMFFWDNGVIWAHSIPGRPALEVVSGALYFLGIVSLLVRYVRKRNWMDLFLLAAIPMMLMPSILSLAYPGENPSLNRSAGAMVPVFVVIGLAFETIIRSIRQRMAGRVGSFAGVLIAVALVFWSGRNNYDLVFNQYYQIYRASSWNSSEIGEVAQFFIESLGSPSSTYIVGYPHWVDSRLVAINAGYPGMDFAIFPEQIPETTANPAAKMFFLNVNDNENMQLLQDNFEDGVLWQYDSEVENKDFMIFFVPPSQGVTP